MKFDGKVQFEAAGKQLVFCLDVNALCELHAALGLADDVDTVRHAFAKERLRSIPNIRQIVFHGTRASWPGMTLEDAGAVITELGFAEAGSIVGRGMLWALPDQEPVEDGGPPPRPSSGPTSTSTRPERGSRRRT